MLIAPRLTDYHGIHLPQASLDFAVPFVEEDIPLYVDPFLLWRSAMSGHVHPLTEPQKTSEEVLFLRDQVKKKDEQIGALLERDRETNVLIKGLQGMLLSLTAPRSGDEPPDASAHARQSTTYEVETKPNPKEEGEGGP